MEILKLILEKPEATAQIIGSIFTGIAAIIGAFSVWAKFWVKTPKTKKGRAVKTIVNACALNPSPVVVEGDK